ncbi:RluA family pseudouridine synthase [Candidatus Daviesbacteria bacterium]|nr:RluA family pseudouridine synthase [Candidatus Daviesbacteria bacterium]
MLAGRDQLAWEFLNAFDKHVLYEDQDVLIINKPAGIASHYSEVNPVGIEEIAKHLRGWNTQRANRLDRDTTGVMVFSKTRPAFISLFDQFANKAGSNMRKIYLAILEGELDFKEPFKAELPIAPTQTERMQIVTPEQSGRGFIPPGAKNSITFFKPLVCLKDGEGRIRTLTEVQIVTGRTHQIRVVSADYLKHPIVGDYLYCGDAIRATRTMLHAFELTFQHPIKLNMRTIQAPIPEDFQQSIKNMEWQYFYPNYKP